MANFQFEQKIYIKCMDEWMGGRELDCGLISKVTVFEILFKMCGTSLSVDKTIKFIYRLMMGGREVDCGLISTNPLILNVNLYEKRSHESRSVCYP